MESVCFVDQTKEILRFESNGDTYVCGRRVWTDKESHDAFVEWLNQVGSYPIQNSRRNTNMANEGTYFSNEPTPVVAGCGPQEATIKKVENGFIIKVGCKTFVATKFSDVAEGLREYYEDPIAAEKKYCKK
jgi:hypothetical protein